MIETLLAAVRAGDQDTVSALLDAGGDVNAPAPDGSVARPLHVAAAAGDLGMCDLLIDYGALLDTRQADGATALHLAAAIGAERIVDLFRNGAVDGTIADNEGHTAADYAERAGFGALAHRLRWGG